MRFEDKLEKAGETVTQSCNQFKSKLKDLTINTQEQCDQFSKKMIF